MTVERTGQFDPRSARADRLIKPEQPLAGLRVLVVDDSEISQMVALSVIESQGGMGKAARDGREAVDLLRASEHAFDAVLMDLQMPIMDGFVATRAIRGTAGLETLPIIALTSGSLLEEGEQVRAAGMNGFIGKPFQVDELTSLILSVCRGNPARTRASLDDADLADLDPARALTGWQTELAYAQALQRFIRAHACTAAEMSSLVDSGDTLSAARLAHQLRGVAGHLAMPLVHSLAGQLEQAFKADAVPAAVLETFAEAMRTAMDAAKAFAAQFDAALAPPTATNQEKPAVVLQLLLTALDQQDLDTAMQAIAALTGKIAAVEIESIRLAVDEFDFAAAQRRVEKLMLNPATKWAPGLSGQECPARSSTV